ncbi:MAG: zinc ribbon domain-containing protein [Anaerolineae bacterium]|nr:zinc ribbon domain-containing protein [Anaerolineae bacterium]
MSDIIDSIKQGANQVLSNLDQQGHIRAALEGLRSQWSEVERRRHVSQLSAQVHALQAELRQLTEALGLQVLSLYDAGTISHPELRRLCERINELRAEAEVKKAELADLEAQAAPQTVKCPQCGTLAAPDAEFCPKCGGVLKPAPPTAEGTPPPPATKVVRLRCPRCKTVLPGPVGFCPTCGVKLRMPNQETAPAHFCRSCGAEIDPRAKFCPTCGQAVQRGA